MVSIIAQQTIPRLWRRIGVYLALIAICVGAFPAARATHDALRAQPQLMEFVAAHPGARVSIIVQKVAGSVGVEENVSRLGGTVTHDLSIINALAAEMPTSAIEQLAQTHGVRWISLDAPVVQASAPCAECINTTPLDNAYIKTLGVDKLWNEGPSYLQGQGVSVAVVDSGIATHKDFSLNASSQTGSRVIRSLSLNQLSPSPYDGYGHGTHVAGIIGGNGARSGGRKIGIAPKVNLINVKVSDDTGAARMADVVMGLAWVLLNKSRYNIRVVNLSINSSVPESYHTSPLSAAVEILWFNGVVVVVSAGNNGSATLYPPANDPFVITVGATDDKGTADQRDDEIASFSAYGTTADGVVKPDIVAPGKNIIAPLAKSTTKLAQSHADHLVTGFAGSPFYFRMSGTSMAAPMVAGSVALLLQNEPELMPDQVKYRLMATATHDTTLWPAYNTSKAGAGYLNTYAAVHGTTTEFANTGMVASQLLWSGSEPVTWNSVNWNSVNWNSVNWNSVNWNSVNWNSTYWGE